jgi:primosomal protein N' (replication factor Y)
LQTYNPGHFSIKAAKDQDFHSFYNQEMSFRKALNYPPFSRMIQLKISGKDRLKARDQAARLGDICRKMKTADPALYSSVEIMGPIEASLAKIAQRYRWQILLKGLHVKALHKFMGQLLSENPTMFNHYQVRVIIDVDPMTVM